MENETFRTRLAALLKKSRKALRLYTTMGRIQNGEQAELSEKQVQEWREVNSDLVKQLTAALEQPNQRRLAQEVHGIRDRFYQDWRSAEADLHQKRKHLLSAVQNGDFIKASILSSALVILKAREQASHAAHHEVQQVLSKSKISSRVTKEKVQVPLVKEEKPAPPEPKGGAKVIPLRKRNFR